MNSNSTYISRAINTQRSCTFSQFVNAYRISYAQHLLRQQPDIKIFVLSAASGFATEPTFFRTFNAHSGVTPREWTAKND